MSFDPPKTAQRGPTGANRFDDEILFQLLMIRQKLKFGPSWPQLATVEGGGLNWVLKANFQKSDFPMVHNFQTGSLPLNMSLLSSDF